MQVDTEGIYGSSTFCLVVIDRRRSRMHSACLGDSSIMVIGATPDEPEVRPSNRVPLAPCARSTAACPQSVCYTLHRTLPAVPRFRLTLWHGGCWWEGVEGHSHLVVHVQSSCFSRVGRVGEPRAHLLLTLRADAVCCAAMLGCPALPGPLTGSCLPGHAVRRAPCTA